METTYKDFMEAKVKSWADMKDRNVLKAAEKHMKRMKSGQVLGYTTAHQEFTIFHNEKEWNDAIKHAKDMKWIRVE
jgi:glutamine synthetase